MAYLLFLMLMSLHLWPYVYTAYRLPQVKKKKLYLLTSKREIDKKYVSFFIKNKIHTKITKSAIYNIKREIFYTQSVYFSALS